MEPVVGEKLELPAGLPMSIEAALQRYGTSTMKAPAATVLDNAGKVGTTLLYGTSEVFLFMCRTGDFFVPICSLSLSGRVGLQMELY